MPKKDQSTYEKIAQSLFKPKEEAELFLTPREMEIKNRLMICVSRKMENPLELDSQTVNFLKGGCGGVCTPVSQSQAYRDVAALTKIVGNIELSSKCWYRYMIVEGAKKGYEIACDNHDAKGIAANLDKIGKYTRADKDDDAFDFSQMIPPSFEPTDDVTVVDNMKQIDNLEAEREAFRSLFKKDLKSRAVDTVTETETDHDNG